MPKTASQIGHEIRELRRRLDLTQAELAARVGVDPQTVARWERGERTPGGDTYRKIRAIQDGVVGTVPPGSERERTKRIDRFGLEMARLGADDFEVDTVRRAAQDFLESIMSFGGTDPDAELDRFMQVSLRAWVEDHMAARKRREEE